MTTETQTKSVTYITDRPTLTLVIEAEDNVRNHAGRVISKIEPTRLIFKDHRCKIVAYDGPVERNRGQAQIRDEIQGMKFEELIEVVESHRFYKRRFWRESDTPHERHPTLPELRKQMEGASREELSEMLAEERSTHNRPDAIAMIGEAALGGPSRNGSDGADGKDNAGGTDDIR